MLNFIKNISTTELLIIALVLIFLFGSKKIAQLGKASGETAREIKKIKKEFTKAIDAEKEV